MFLHSMFYYKPFGVSLPLQNSIARIASARIGHELSLAIPRPQRESTLSYGWIWVTLSLSLHATGVKISTSSAQDAIPILRTSLTDGQNTSYTRRLGAGTSVCR